MKKIFVIINLLLSVAAFAGHEKTINSLSGNLAFPIALGAQVSLTDQWYPFPSGWATQFANESANGAVVLRYDDQLRTFTSHSWRLEVKYDATVTNASGSTTTYSSQSLIINYDPVEGIRYTDRDKKIYSNCHKIVVQIIPVTGVDYDEWDAAGSPVVTNQTYVPTFLDDIYFDVELDIERYYNLSAASATTIYTNYLTATNELAVSWNYIEGAESYDLEWLFIDVGDVTYPFTASYAYDWRNATHVNVPGQDFRISLAYPKGILLVRVRGVGIDWTNYTTNGYLTRGDGTWTSTATTGTTGTYSGTRYDIQSGLLPGMNWAYSASFAEDGKRMEGAEFYDGMMRGREAITTVNTDGNVVVGQTYYDYEGRPAAGVLPYAETSDGITYYTADQSYNCSDFDTDAKIENPDVMGTTGGAGQYYSPSSTTTDVGLPDANGFPYSRVVYMNDGTNRPQKSGAAGEDLGMSGANETQYFYGTPSQAQLDRLFGNEVGYASHYKKNFVIDPNGVISVSYIDQSGNVVATALAGSAPANLQAIDNPNENPNTVVSMTDDLLVNNGVTTNGNGSESQFTLTVLETGAYDFTYLLGSDNYCGASCYNVCKNCVYDLQISIVNTVTGDSIDIAPALTNIEIIKKYVITTDNTTFSVTLDPGTYRVQKILTLNQANLATVRQDYISAQATDPTPCVSAVAASPVPCPADCDDACTDHYYRNGLYYDDAGVQCSTSVGLQLIADCQRMLCDEPVVSDPCEVKHDVMIADMSPGGQYFDNLPSQYTYNSTTGSQTINGSYDINGWLSAHDKSTTMIGDINTAEGTSYTTWAQIRANWEAGWADILVYYHPEYCAWNYFCGWTCNPGGVVYDAGDSWNYEMATLYSTGGDVVPANNDNFYWNPLNMTVDNTAGDVDGNNSDYMPYGGSNTSNQDPRFAGSCNFNICSSPTITAEDSLKGYLQHFYLGKDENGNNLPYHFSAWYVATDPDNIHGGGSENSDLHQSTIDFFQMLHGGGSHTGLINSSPSAGQVTSYQFFRSVYFYYRTLMIEQGFAGDGGVTTCRSTYTDDDVPTFDSDGYVVAGSDYPGQTSGGFTILFQRSELIDIYGNGCNNPSASTLTTTLTDIIEDGDANPNNIDNDVPSNIGCTCELLDAFATERGISLTDYTAIANELNNVFAPATNYTAIQVQNWMTECDEATPSMNDLNTVNSPVVFPVELTCSIDIGITNLNQAAQDNCEQENLDLANYNAWFLYQQQLNAAADAYMDAYIQNCIEHLEPGNAETFTVEYDLHEYYYTLYYYDQAGNLIKTVPPEGVNLILPTDNRDADAYTDLVETGKYRDDFKNGTSTTGVDYMPAIHDMRSQYAYNSLQQPVKAQQNEGGNASPEFWESGETSFWYDYLGRMVVSQNSKQLAMSPDAYSYTIYDELGRIEEVGEIHTSSTLATNGTGSRNSSGQYYYFDIVSATTLSTWLGTGTKNDVTTTYYDVDPAISSDATAAFANGLENTRNRVTAVVYDDDPTSEHSLYNFTLGGTQPDYVSAYFYSYDIHGNVKQVVQETPALKTHNQNVKSTTYEYDLISGNVNAVHYQDGERDEFHHKYEYDADNRLKVAYSSRDGVNWEKETKQFYYQAGGVSRLEIGDKTVQGLDYAFTINGWLKGMNRNTIGDNGKYQEGDLGQDGVESTTNINGNISTDAAGFTLHYYQTTADYTPIYAATPDFEADMGGTAYGNGITDQYNGNIAGMTTAMQKADQIGAEVQGRAFTYDQLYRIKSSLGYHISASTLSTTGWQTSYTQDNRYKEAFTYDWNGNIKTVERYDGTATTAVKSDGLTYNYAANSNLLTSIDDTQNACTYTDDLDGQSASNYLYDAIGEMIDDVSERITDIEWTPYGKVKAVHKDQANNTNSCTSTEYGDADVEFLYTAGQQRLCKIIKPHKPAGAGITDQDEWIYYWYVYDAGGNVMGVYKHSFEDDPAPGTGDYIVHIDLDEHGVYGSGRTGIRNADDESDYYQNFTTTLTAGKFNSATPTGSSPAYSKTHYTRTIGYKQYEVANHLGNVLVTVSDKRLLYTAAPSTATEVDWYTADVISYSDYYAFGAMQTGRAGGSYRYGLNGMEKCDEVHNNNGDFYLADYRAYDARSGRWLSKDPIVKAHESPYASFANNPIYFIDPSGLDAEDWVKRSDGSVYWDENVSSSDDADLKEGEKYLGKEIEFGFRRDGKSYGFRGYSNGEYYLYWYNSVTVTFDDGKADPPAPNNRGNEVFASIIQNYGDCTRFGQFAYTDPSANTIYPLGFNTSTFSAAGAHATAGGFVQYRTWYMEENRRYLYSGTQFSTLSYGPSFGFGGSVTYSYGTGTMDGMNNVWAQPSGIVMASNSYSLGGGVGIVGGNLEAGIGNGQGYFLIDGAVGFYSGFNSSQYGANNFIDGAYAMPLSGSHGPTLLTSPEASRTRLDTLRVLEWNPNDHSPLTDSIRNIYMPNGN